MKFKKEIELLLNGGGVLLASEEVVVTNGSSYTFVETNNTNNIYLLYCYSDSEQLEFSTDGQKWHKLKHLIGTDYKIIIYPKMQFTIKNNTGIDATITASLWRPND